jgi:hypothetical protein
MTQLLKALALVPLNGPVGMVGVESALANEPKVTIISTNLSETKHRA